MRVVVAPQAHTFPPNNPENVNVVLYSQTPQTAYGSVGATLAANIARNHLAPSERAWDFMSIALAVTAADLGVPRSLSPDGWTRELDIEVAVVDPTFWTTQKEILERILGFLTTDRWSIAFVSGGVVPVTTAKVINLQEDCVALLSGGLDSLIGNIDLVSEGRKPFLVSHVVPGDRFNQIYFAKQIGTDLNHLALNHNVRMPTAESPPSQRARSFAFIAYGTLVASALELHKQGATVPLYVSENGFISINPPLTDSRLGSLSTRTTHPFFLTGLQEVLDASDIRTTITNPYRLHTKGEMVDRCKDQALLAKLGGQSTSCGRYRRFNYHQCGRCLPCLVRRAAYAKAGLPDTTKEYVYQDLGAARDKRGEFDDITAFMTALEQMSELGFDAWVADSLIGVTSERSAIKQTVERGIIEIRDFLAGFDEA